MDDKLKIAVMATGCPECRNDSATVEEIFKVSGYSTTEDYRDADYIFLHLCAMSLRTENDSIELFTALEKKKKKEATLIPYGCLTKINKERLDQVYQGPTFGPEEWDQINQILPIQDAPETIKVNHIIPKSNAPKDINIFFEAIKHFIDPWSKKDSTVESPETFYIKVATGCLNHCSFCAIKKSRGHLKSKPFNQILDEFDKGLEQGAKEFGIIGTEIAAYGMEQGLTIIDVLKEMIKREGDYKIKLRNFHPRLLIKMFPELMDILRSGKISYIGTAIESGNNRILQLMRRGHKVEDFETCLRSLNQNFPKLIVNTQVMIGFPGETEEEFNDTVALLNKVKFNFVETYIFQPRPCAEAVTMGELVPAKIAKKRFRKLFLQSLFRPHILLW